MVIKKFTILRNRHKKIGSQEPDFLLSAKIGDVFQNIGGGWEKKDKNDRDYLAVELSDIYSITIKV